MSHFTHLRTIATLSTAIMRTAYLSFLACAFTALGAPAVPQFSMIPTGVNPLPGSPFQPMPSLAPGSWIPARNDGECTPFHT